MTCCFLNLQQVCSAIAIATTHRTSVHRCRDWQWGYICFTNASHPAARCIGSAQANLDLQGCAVFPLQLRLFACWIHSDSIAWNAHVMRRRLYWYSNITFHRKTSPELHYRRFTDSSKSPLAEQRGCINIDALVCIYVHYCVFNAHYGTLSLN